ncbi:DUF1707 and DUF4190 domain-containing protein [Actinopolymorpha sp. NPDC004070]|uniref:DUF1707 and DUF4190 domain-containing protein n=1 Tax=Actinopolymorpha sp. NPDC004070 TaxID=3154548 RepID=UPI0033A6C979
MNNWHTMRASDADRERAADILKAAFAEGRLNPTEHRTRLDAVLRSQTYGEIQRQVADLPAGPAPFVPPSFDAANRALQANPWGPNAIAPVRRTEPLAKASLIMGAVAPLTCGMSAIPAIITGHLALGRVANSGDDGRGMAIGGLVLGYLHVVGGAVFMLAAMLFGLR